MDKQTIESEQSLIENSYTKAPQGKSEVLKALQEVAAKLQEVPKEVLDILQTGIFWEIIEIVEGVTAHLLPLSDEDKRLIASLDDTETPEVFPYETKEQFVRITKERVTTPALILNALKGLNKVLACIDGGIVGNHHHKAGSGILLGRKKLTLPIAEVYTPLLEVMGRLNLPTTMFADADNYSVLLPKKELLDMLGKKHLKVVTSHHECGAAKLDMRRILEAMLFELYLQLQRQSPVTARFTLVNALVRAGEPHTIKDVPTRSLIHLLVDAILAQLPPEFIDVHAATYSETLAKALGVKHRHIAISEMARPEGEHNEEAAYIDFLCGIKDGVGLNPRELGLPQGFKFQPKASSWTDIQRELKVAIGIAFGETGMHKRRPFTKERPFQIALFMSPQHPFLDENIQEKEYDMRVLVKEYFPKYRDCIHISTFIPCLGRPEANRFETLLEAAVAYKDGRKALKKSGSVR